MKPFVPLIDTLGLNASIFLFLAGIESPENGRHYTYEKLLRRAYNQDHLLHEMIYCSHKLAGLRSLHPLETEP